MLTVPEIDAQAWHFEVNENLTSVIAAYVAFLLSDEAAFVTGGALAIDGGATA